MSESIETKQQYLRSEIIDQGYNPGEFSDFMGSIRGEDGLDLETWSFADLKAVVSQFKSQYSNQQPEPEMPNQYEPQEQKQDTAHKFSKPIHSPHPTNTKQKPNIT